VFEKTDWILTHKQAGSHFPFKFAQEGRAEGTTEGRSSAAPFAFHAHHSYGDKKQSS